MICEGRAYTRPTHWWLCTHSLLLSRTSAIAVTSLLSLENLKEKKNKDPSLYTYRTYTLWIIGSELLCNLKCMAPPQRGMYSFTFHHGHRRKAWFPVPPKNQTLKKTEIQKEEDAKYGPGWGSSRGGGGTCQQDSGNVAAEPLIIRLLSQSSGGEPSFFGSGSWSIWFTMSFLVIPVFPTGLLQIHQFTCCAREGDLCSKSWLIIWRPLEGWWCQGCNTRCWGQQEQQCEMLQQWCSSLLNGLLTSGR